MIGRGVAERTHHDAVAFQQPVLRVQPPRRTDGKRRADRLGQMAGDGRGLRRDHQRPRSQDLVPPARHWILRRTGKRQQHVPHHLLARHLAGACDLERGVAVMQERHVGRAQRMGHRRHALVPAGADGVKPLPRLLHGAAGQIERAAGHLRAKQRHRLDAAQGLVRRDPGGKIPRRDTAVEIGVHDCNTVHHIPRFRPGP